MPQKPDHDKPVAPALTPSTAGPASPQQAPEPAAVFTPDELLTLLVCPVCQGDLEAYAGTNPHKLGSAFCRPCGQRVRSA